jgi:hypothetical protein
MGKIIFAGLAGALVGAMISAAVSLPTQTGAGADIWLDYPNARVETVWAWTNGQSMVTFDAVRCLRGLTGGGLDLLVPGKIAHIRVKPWAESKLRDRVQSFDCRVLSVEWDR